jgi:poly(3-hydroxybutyrate) depolymerase
MGAQGRAVLVAIVFAGCPKPSPKPSGQPHPLIEARPYEEKIPSTIDSAKRYPLLLVLHGLGASGAGVRRYYHTDTLADELGFLIAYPNGSSSPSDGSRSWDGTGTKDVEYLDAVIDEISAKYPVDPQRIFVAGSRTAATWPIATPAIARSGSRRSWFRPA